MSDSSPNSLPFTSDLQEVIAQEQAYLQQRRQTLSLPEHGPTWGLALSGGGIRAASLSLGMIQQLIVAGDLEKFDYLSSVSGGGYLGSCLSSLMNEDPAVFVQPSYVTDPSRIPGFDSDTSPLAMLIDRVETPTPSADVRARGAFLPSDLKGQVESPPDLTVKPASQTRLNAKIQLEHLQRHSEYLSVDPSFSSPDLLRLVGTLVSGSLYTILIFLLALLGTVSLFHFLLELASAGQFFEGLKGGPAADMGGFWQAWGDFFNRIGKAMVYHPASSILASLVGAGVGATFLVVGVSKFRAGLNGNLSVVSADRNPEQNFLQKLIDRFFLINLLVIPVTWLGWIVANSFAWVPGEAYSVIWVLPLLYSLGTFIACLTLVPFVGWNQRNTRSLSQGMLGSTVYLLLINLLIPLMMGAVFLVGYYFDVILSTGFAALSSVGATALGYLIASVSASGKEESNQPSFIATLLPIL
ncbi:MAG: patatin-like phospholipase family protein, partial [Bacteroidota bacterium]